MKDPTEIMEAALLGFVTHAVTLPVNRADDDEESFSTQWVAAVDTAVEDDESPNLWKCSCRVMLTGAIEKDNTPETLQAEFQRLLDAFDSDCLPQKISGAGLRVIFVSGFNVSKARGKDGWLKVLTFSATVQMPAV